MSLSSSITASEVSHYFSRTSQEAIERFKAECKNLEARFEELPVEGEGDLPIATCYRPATASETRILVVAAGTHGAETFIGGAIQLFIARKILPHVNLKHTGILFLHGIDPHGFKNFRRATSRNVDLNRNFLPEASSFHEDASERYDGISKFLNPAGPVNLRSLQQRFFTARALWLALRRSPKELRQTILEGQYQQADGLLFGGKTYEPHVNVLEKFLRRVIHNQRYTLFIDVHSGYGRSSELQLFPNPVEEEGVKKALAQVFQGNKIDYGQGEKGYAAKGSISAYWRRLMKPGQV